jgi:trypsin
LKVRAGATHWNRGGELFNVEKIFNHENYNHRMTDYDFSVIKISKSFSFSNNVKAIKLPYANENVDVGITAVVSGWGLQNNIDEINHETQLKAAEVSVVAFSTCAYNYRMEKMIITSRMICAGLTEGGTDSCKGKISNLNTN